MNSKVLQTLEYEKVKGELLPFIQTEQGAKIVAALQPSSDFQEVSRWLEETAEAAMVERLHGGLALLDLTDIKEQVRRLQIQASLNGKEIVALAKVLKATSAVAHFFQRIQADDMQDSVPRLQSMVDQLVLLPELTKRVEQTIDDNGRVLDSASSALASFRRQMAGKEEAIRQRLANYTRGKSARYLSETIVTKRADRYVLPVKVEYRHQVPGIVHDQSQSGQTYYIEPQSVVEMANELSETRVLALAEENRVLAELSVMLADHLEDLRQNAMVLGKLDFVNAKARLAKAQNAMAPELSEKKEVVLNQAWHPLIGEKKAVKNDIALGEKYETLIITGPNTGGKTITIKTLGLLQLLAQSGLFITVGRPSVVAVFDEIFADIGDEQSIEQNLSTFSSHMENIKGILTRTDENSLLIFDELGAGTDPAEGAALAMAILDRAKELGAQTIATTHYPELKLYGNERSGTENASMVFDIKTLKPTYQLLIGVPGQSNALAIASRLGFDQQLLADAKTMVNPEDQKLNEMIKDLVDQRQAAKTERERLARDQKTLVATQTELEEKTLKLEKEQAKVMLDAKKRANELVSKTKREAEQLIKEIRSERLAGGQKNKLSEQDLQKQKKAIAALQQSDKLEKNKVLQRAKRVKELKPGDDVMVSSYNQQGTLVKKHKNGQWEVQMGILKMLVDEDDLKKTEATAKAQKEKKTKKRQKVAKNAARSGNTGRVQAKLDLRGVRYEAALTDLDRYLDSVVLANLSSVEIIHGKGSGALRQGVTQFLRSDRRVKDFHFASANAGGDGATIVTLR
ncbi:endonuclease MutS2 [Fructobacillus fructosus]|uniref:endonuclease MutS2 n=1 Tax=Fructobacillus fructosus TaxID=1631 RepID=UPI002D9F53F2|nr:dsDNA-specific endonuclease/ATPase MutS2 (MutS2) [Fructobacillus fructosus]CAK1239022.1 dsDNA-specific endonuclease/ATPase MutS2 (MutS2) [Fructobacillus fructosus]CAK1240300.1 dsDNA-specific endonuclease/ATPase MutS2 (MutS2) [Fructobacillus fructosus]